MAAKHSMDLTAEGLKGFVAPAGVDTIWDREVAGFGLRTRGVDKPASWAWVYKYRHRDTREQIKVTLGRFLALTPTQARKEAEKYGAAKKLHGHDLTDESRQKRRDHQAERARLKAQAEAEAGKADVSLLWERYWAAEGKFKKASKSYQQLWTSHLLPSFGVMKVEAVTPATVEEFKASRVATPGACNRALALLSIMMTKAVTWGWRRGCAPEHPVRAGAVRRYDETKVEFYFEAEELGRILEAADGYATGAANRTNQGRRLHRSEGVGLAIRMLAMTGARASEVLGAHWGQFSELPDGRLGWTVESTNTKIGRTIPRALDADLSRRLLQWKPLSLAITAKPSLIRLRTPRWVFPQARNPSMPVKRIENAWREIKKAAGISRQEAKAGRIHDLRHSAATHMLRGGASMTAVQHQLGHATPLTTNRYVHVMPAGMVESGDLLGVIASNAQAAARSRKKSGELAPFTG